MFRLKLAIMKPIPDMLSSFEHTECNAFKISYPIFSVFMRLYNYRVYAVLSSTLYRHMTQ